MAAPSAQGRIVPRWLVASAVLFLVAFSVEVAHACWYTCTSRLGFTIVREGQHYTLSSCTQTEYADDPTVYITCYYVQMY